MIRLTKMLLLPETVSFLKDEVEINLMVSYQ